MIDARVKDIAREVDEAGGRALVVGGYVRDYLRGEPSKDLDIEVYGIDVDALRELLGRHGSVLSVGRAFGVLRLKELDIDFSVPRRDSKVAPGHRGFEVACDPNLDFRSAARRRDLTVNSMGLDIITGEILDPYGGRRDLERRLLRAVDPATFPEDPLRGLRVAQFSARLNMRADKTLVRLCSRLDLGEVSPERVFEEFRKLLLKGSHPSLGLSFLRDSALLRFFPELDGLTDAGDDQAWSRTLAAADKAAKARRGDRDDLVLMLGAMCHAVRRQGDAASEGEPAAVDALLARMRAPNDVVESVSALVDHIGGPDLLSDEDATPKEYRRLSRELAASGVSLELLARVTGSVDPGPAVKRFLQRARELGVDRRAPADVVRGRHLVARGFEPGPRFGAILELCRDVQDEKGWVDPDRILDEALTRSPGA
ncbi:MAG: hypothetical protein OXP28_16565 [Gammaproteobacteria bacterium]|nr:hypothetical protein [Gammaproteobacteria bacterium]